MWSYLCSGVYCGRSSPTTARMGDGQPPSVGSAGGRSIPDGRWSMRVRKIVSAALKEAEGLLKLGQASTLGATKPASKGSIFRVTLPHCQKYRAHENSSIRSPVSLCSVPMSPRVWAHALLRHHADVLRPSSRRPRFPY